jgi:hypothetical protein
VGYVRAWLGDTDSMLVVTTVANAKQMAGTILIGITPLLLSCLGRQLPLTRIDLRNREVA